jgi:hypothetical protein
MPQCGWGEPQSPTGLDLSEVIDDVKDSLIAVAELSQSFILDAKFNLESRYRSVYHVLGPL